jgi:serine/threonine protein kinase
MDGALDPRWNRQPGVQTALDSPQRNPVSREASFNRVEGSSGSYSIVFSASWVRITTPIGEGAFSRVYEGIYTNPETGEQSVVAVKILKKNMLKRRSDCLRFIKEAKIMTKISHK